MVTQVTISPSFQKKMDKLEELIGDQIDEKLLSLGTYAVEISPVYSGAFAESWSIRPIGSGGGRSRKSRPDKVPDVQSKKEEAKGLIAGDVAQYSEQILKDGGAVLTNRSPHAREVDVKYATVARVKDRFR
ncbi:hypothetical protein OAI16_06705 [Flavobacteriaceae bacterium]|nr:hypothetical protein [Flavobacteriaceae bacterium]|tara:strand:+ start:202 stop:594 length:393 start_codon:yes stop_codon:yes gene_type:complete